MSALKTITLSVGAVIFRGPEVLLIQRGKPPFAGHWSIPGGKVAFGESLKDAVEREIKEETGVTIELIGLIDAFEALPAKADEPHFVMIDYVAEWRAGEPRAGDDAIDAGFFPFDEALSRLAWDKTRTALQWAQKARMQHQRSGDTQKP